jgi:hypothetical protein
MEYIFKLDKNKFYNKSIRFVISLLLVSFCISGVRCGPGTYGPWIAHEVGIQPLPENHGRWSKEEVDTVIETIATTAKYHGLKDVTKGVLLEKGWEVNEYALSGKHFQLTLSAYYVWHDRGSGSVRHFRLTSKNPKAKGTICIDIESIFEPYHQISDSESQLVEKIWHEVLDRLRNKFGDRIEDGRLETGSSKLKIYVLEP